MPERAETAAAKKLKRAPMKPIGWLVVTGLMCGAGEKSPP